MSDALLGQEEDRRGRCMAPLLPPRHPHSYTNTMLVRCQEEDHSGLVMSTSDDVCFVCCFCLFFHLFLVSVSCGGAVYGEWEIGMVGADLGQRYHSSLTGPCVS